MVFIQPHLAQVLLTIKRMTESTLKRITGIMLGVTLICPSLWAADVGITSSTGNRGSTPSTTPASTIYAGHGDDVTPPQVVSIVTNYGTTIGTSNSNVLADFNGSPIGLTITFDKDMMNGPNNTSTGASYEDISFTCTDDSSVATDSNTLGYSSSRVLVMSANKSLPATGTCQLLLNRGNDHGGTITATGSIRDTAHNPTPIALWAISSTCALSDSFVRDTIGCWSDQNSNNGSFSISGGALSYSSDKVAVSGTTAPALRKTGISLQGGQTDLTVSLKVSAVSGLQNGDGIGLRFTDTYGDYVILLVYNDGVSNRYNMIFSNGTTTSTAYLDGADPTYYYNAITNNTMMLHIADNGLLAYPYGRNTLNNLTTDPDNLVWAGPSGKFGSSNVTVDIVGIKGSNPGHTVSATLDDFTVTHGVKQ